MTEIYMNLSDKTINGNKFTFDSGWSIKSQAQNVANSLRRIGILRVRVVPIKDVWAVYKAAGVPLRAG